MALFLVVLGGAAVVEVHRAITGGGQKDIAILKQKEEALRRQLQELQKELQETKSQRELTEQEAARLVAINEHLSKEKEELEKESLSLKNANASLETQAEELRAKQLLLEQCSESLKLENTLLIQQFDRLKLKYEQESLSSQKQLQELKTCVTNTVQKYIHGETNLQELVFSLGEVGVEVVLPSNANIGVSAEVTKQQIEAAETVEERTEAVQQLELKVGESWLQQIRFVMSSPSRVAKLMTGASDGIRDGGLISEVANEQQLQLISPRTLDAAEQQAAQKMASHVAAGNKIDDREAETIRAVHQQTDPIKQEEQPKKENTKSRSILFRPLRNRTVKNNADQEKQRLVEMEVPFDVVPRLNFNFQGDESTLSSSGTMVPM